MSETDASPIDRVRQDKVREILVLLEKAVSAARLFPSDHPTVGHFITDLYHRLTEYLDGFGGLEFGIEEQSFVLDGKVVLEEENTARSLPFFFFKDGMRGLEICMGLQKAELEGFLRAIREVAQLPPEEGDIVNALWERDFPNIRHFAPDDYLETKIGVGRPPLRPETHIGSLSQGRVDLAPEDLEEIRKNVLALNRSKENRGAAADPAYLEDLGRTLTRADNGETTEIDALLSASRQLSPKDEYLSLILELIYLEDRPEQFPAIADLLEQYHQQTIRERDFRRASRLLEALNQIKNVYAEKNELKSNLVDSIVALLSRKSNLVELRDSLDLGSIWDSPGLLEYLRFFGPRSAGLVADVYERSSSPDWRGKALQRLKEIGRTDLHELMDLVQDSRPSLSQEIIGFLGESGDKRTLTFLANIVSYKNAAVKLAAIRALGRLQDQAAGKVLLGFLADPDEEVRAGALDNMKGVSDKQILSHIFEAIAGKSFAGSSEREKRALFGALSRSESQEACAFLRRILTTATFLPSSKKTELSLYSLTALEQMGISQAADALREGAKRRHGKIRRACLKALQAKTDVTTAHTGKAEQ
jgi:HEAT repeat protein